MAQSYTGNDEFAKVYEKHFNMVWHICLAYMKNPNDAEDALQETFLRFLRNKKEFSEKKAISKEEQEKAWLIVVAKNVCKNLLKSWWRKNEPYEDYESVFKLPPYEIDTTLAAVMELPDKYKVPIYLYYYQDYNSNQIAELLHKPKSTIRNYLSSARKLLKDIIGDI